MSSDLVKRLRSTRWQGTSIVNELSEAANRIEALEAEVTRLKMNIGCARGQRTTQWCAEASDAMQNVRAAEARVERLRWALRAIANEVTVNYLLGDKDIARKALKDDKQ